jgi:hypothetical protein
MNDQKQRVNKKQNVEIDSPGSNGGPGEYKKHVTFSWPTLEAALSIFNLCLFFVILIKKETAINAKP